MALNKVETSEIIKKFGKDAKDTGSPEVQIALLTARIKALTEHLKSNQQDAGARRSDADRYAALIEKLGLRK